MTRSPLTDPRPGDVVEAKHRNKTTQRRVVGVWMTLSDAHNCKNFGRHVVEYRGTKGVCRVWLSSWQEWCCKYKAKPAKDSK